MSRTFSGFSYFFLKIRPGWAWGRRSSHKCLAYTDLYWSPRRSGCEDDSGFADYNDKSSGRRVGLALAEFSDYSVVVKLISWNVNGLRAILGKGFLAWLADAAPDILCLQETRAQPEQLPEELLEIGDYYSFFGAAERNGYSGTALYSLREPADLKAGIGVARFDSEGRVIIADYGDFLLLNIYFPNGGQSDERLRFKLEFYDACLDYLRRAQKSQANIIICGDVNTAHREIDLARPKENEKNTGFLPEERAWIDELLDAGFIDTFRHFNCEPDHYTWWDYKTRARGRNVGWRIDYFFVSSALEKMLRGAFILPEVMGSDHCPVGIEIDTSS